MHLALKVPVDLSGPQLQNEANLIAYKNGFNMPNNPHFAEAAPHAVRSAAAQLGSRIRLARQRRGLRLRDLAERAGVAYDTARAVEQGKLMTSVGAYFAMIWALGLDRELTSMMDPDHDLEGKQLALSRTPKRVRVPNKGLDDDF